MLHKHVRFFIALLIGTNAMAESDLRLILGETPPAKFSLSAVAAGTEIEVWTVRGHSDAAQASEKVFASQFQIRTSARGEIDFTRDIPVDGWPRTSLDSPGLAPIRTPDVWGPLWSMKTTPRAALPAALREHTVWGARLARLTYENVLYVFIQGGQVVSGFSLDILRTHPSLLTSPIDAERERFVGSFTYPENCQGCPGLVIWGGSGGPVSPEVVAYYANRGVAVLSIQYFTMNAEAAKPYLTHWIRETELEVFERAIEWIKKQNQVDPERVAIMGGSRGGEAALLVGVHYEGQLAGVVAHRPHFASMSSALSGNTPIALCRDETFSWTHRGVGVPYLPIARDRPNQAINELAELTGGVTIAPEGYPVISVLPGFVDADRRLEARGPAAVEAVRIPVERIRAPVYASAGERDAMWIAPKALRVIATARESTEIPLAYRALDFFHQEPEAGHVSQLPGTPTMESTRIFTPGSYLDPVDQEGRFTPTRSVWVLGGNPEANHRGNLNFSRTGLAFLGRVYKQDLVPMPLP